MQYLLKVVASDRTGQAVACTFKATADGATLATKDDTDPLFEIPAGTQTVEVTAKPTRPVFWEETFSFSIAADGSMTADVDVRPRVNLMVAPMPWARLTLANVKVSQFRDRTADVFDLLNHPPSKRMFFNLKKKDWEEREVDEVKNHKKMYGTWPPPDWELYGVPEADFLDVGSPLKSGVLNFTKDPSLALQIDVDNVVLERAGVGMVPQYFAVTWPQAIAPKANAPPTPFLLYIRQGNKGNGYDLNGIFVGGGLAPYPNNFDYADSGMFESLHYARSPLWYPNSKGVPYQAARAGANVVTVLPCNSFDENFRDLNNPEETETILLELQAFMFWRGGVAAPPNSAGKTAIAAFSSANFFIDNWLKDDTKRKGHFLSSVVSAVYFLEPMRNYVDAFIASALKWAAESADKRIRLYMQFPWPSLKQLVDKPLPAAPYFANSSDGRRTVSVVTNATWSRAFRRPASNPIPWVYVHHAVAATMLTHALAQGDF
jgi:hypothetical protein